MKLGRFIVSVGLGAVIGTLLAPKKGSETLEDLKVYANKTYDDLKNLTKEDIEAKIGDSIDQLKKAVDEFDAKEFEAYSKAKLEELLDLMDDYATKIKDSEQYAYAKENAMKAYELLKVKINELLKQLTDAGVDVKEVQEKINQVEEEIEEVIKDDK